MMKFRFCNTSELSVRVVERAAQDVQSDEHVAMMQLGVPIERDDYDCAKSYAKLISNVLKCDVAYHACGSPEDVRHVYYVGPNCGNCAYHLEGLVLAGTYCEMRRHNTSNSYTCLSYMREGDER